MKFQIKWESQKMHFPANEFFGSKLGSVPMASYCETKPWVLILHQYVMTVWKINTEVSVGI